MSPVVFAAEAATWPALPEADGDCMVPAQEWPREPGPREVKIYIHYPGAALANVNARTGLFLDLHNWGAPTPAERRILNNLRTVATSSPSAWTTSRAVPVKKRIRLMISDTCKPWMPRGLCISCTTASMNMASRYVGNPAHLATMKELSNPVKMLVVHGAGDDVCPVEDARAMVANMEASGMDAEAVWVTEDMVDGETFKSTGHSMGDRTRIVFEVAGHYLLPDSPGLVVREGVTDFERKEPILYDVPGGAYVISYEKGYPVGTFQRGK